MYAALHIWCIAIKGYFDDDDGGDDNDVDGGDDDVMDFYCTDLMADEATCNSVAEMELEMQRNPFGKSVEPPNFSTCWELDIWMLRRSGMCGGGDIFQRRWVNQL